jgi:hypothetical protein
VFRAVGPAFTGAAVRRPTAALSLSGYVQAVGIIVAVAGGVHAALTASVLARSPRSALALLVLEGIGMFVVRHADAVAAALKERVARTMHS